MPFTGSWEYNVGVLTMCTFVLVYLVKMIVMIRNELDPENCLAFSVIGCIFCFLSGGAMLSEPGLKYKETSYMIGGVLVLFAGIIIFVDILLNYFKLCR